MDLRQYNKVQKVHNVSQLLLFPFPLVCGIAFPLVCYIALCACNRVFSDRG